MNPVDQLLLHAINGWVHHSEGWDRFVVYLSDSDLFSGHVILTTFWAAWFMRRPGNAHRAAILATLVGGTIALVIGRAGALLLPFRLRPLHAPALGLALPYGISLRSLHGWSAFPSDHAVQFYTLAFGMFAVSRPLGWFLLVWVTLIEGIVRVYVLLHYPTDILAGVVIGALVAWAVTRARLRDAIARPALDWMARSPATFYAAAAFFSFQIATMYDDARTLLNLLFPRIPTS